MKTQNLFNTLLNVANYKALETKSKMTFLKWQKRKPKFDCECLVLCAYKYNKKYDYNCYLIRRIYFEDKWYWGWCDFDGEEVGDIADLKRELYFVVPLFFE